MIETISSGIADGLLRFSRYAFMPNRLGYCGGDDNRALYDYAVVSAADRGLAEILARFNGAMPYLRLIARASGIGNPFDARVVEAYWIGNDLLYTVEARQLYEHLTERFNAQLQGRVRDLVLGKAPAGARPHHSFHVLDVYSRTGGDAARRLSGMDDCRVSWGRVIAIDGASLLVERQPLELHGCQLCLGAARHQRVLRQIEGRGFADSAVIGDWVSLHWGWTCEVITEAQKRRLESMTCHHLRLASATLY
jgi:hypothetical protein